MTWETVIGFEIHCEMLTETKIFCGCSTHFGQEPNTQTCPVCLGMPGSLPVMNARALDLAMRAALALNCRLNMRTDWERKNYYYPDLPKNYQISQLRNNLGVGGWMDYELPTPEGPVTKRVRIDNVHLEEDAGKNIHPDDPGARYSLVDLNRAGTPLLEIVTEPDLRGAAEAEAFMQAARTLLEYSGVSDCNMHEGRLRFEANISVRKFGDEKLGTKVEVKNVASIKTVLKCIEYETERQIEILEDGGRVRQETRLWDEAKNETRSMRGKEVAHDYRYFPDPDLVEVRLDDAWINRVRAEIPELPAARRQRYMDALGLSAYDAGVLTSQKSVADYFETALAAHNNPKALCNWITGEALRWLGAEAGREIADYPVAAAHLAEMTRMIDEGAINGKIAKQVYAAMMEGGGAPKDIVAKRGLTQVSDAGSIEPAVDEAIAANPKAVEDLRAGNQRAMGALVGHIMKTTKGKANPALVNELITKKLGL